MPVILALETTSDICSVAAGTREQFVVQSKNAPRQHNKLVLYMVDEVCNSLGIERNAIECVAFSAGPGSFTGVRLGAAIAQGIAFGAHAKVFGAPTSLCMAEQLAQTFGLEKEFWTQRLSRRDFVYVAKVGFNGKRCNFIDRDRLVSTSTLHVDQPIYSDESVALSAFEVFNMALRNEALWQPAARALPIYVEGDHPWQPKN